MNELTELHRSGEPTLDTPGAPPEHKRDRIGDLLVAQGVMTPEQVDLVLVAQQTQGGRFGEIAIRMRFAAKQDVQTALERQFGYSNALTVRQSRISQELINALNPVSGFAESIRALRSQLRMRWFDGTPGQSALAMTSVDRGDGKSFIVAALGAAFSQLGDSTIIVDADMRHATQHTLFGLENRLGLSGVLSGRAGLEEIKQIPGLPNLSVLPSGPLPPNPQELLGRATFAGLLNMLSQQYDVILLDTPSAQQAADAHIIAKRAGGCVIVTRRNRTRANEVQRLAAILGGSGIQILGAMFNEY